MSTPKDAFQRAAAQHEAARAMLAALEMAAHQIGTATGESTILEILKVGPLARTIDRAIARAKDAGIVRT